MRLPKWLGRLLCWAEIHERRASFDWVSGRLGAPGRYIPVVKCWRCGRYCE